MSCHTLEVNYLIQAAFLHIISEIMFLFPIEHFPCTCLVFSLSLIRDTLSWILTKNSSVTSKTLIFHSYLFLTHLGIFLLCRLLQILICGPKFFVRRKYSAISQIDYMFFITLTLQHKQINMNDEINGSKQLITKSKQQRNNSENTITLGLCDTI